MCRFGQSSHAPAPPFALALKLLAYSALVASRSGKAIAARAGAASRGPAYGAGRQARDFRCCCGIQSAALRSVGCAGGSRRAVGGCPCTLLHAAAIPEYACRSLPRCSRRCAPSSCWCRRPCKQTPSSSRRPRTPSCTCSCNPQSRPSPFRRSRRCAPSSCWCRRPCKQTLSSSRRPRTLSRTQPQSPVICHCSAVLAGVCRRVVGAVSRAL